MEVINQHHAIPLYHRERTPVPIEQEAGNIVIIMYNIYSKKSNPEQWICYYKCEIHQIKLDGRLSVEDQRY